MSPFINERVMGPAHVGNVAELGCRAALSYRGVAHIAFPVDIQDLEVSADKRSDRNVPNHTSHVFARSAQLPAEGDLQKAADVLNSGKRIAILAGRRALHATAELERIAERLAAPIVKALLGR
jgi:pyruvate dehydrogenase (quinone)